MGKLGFNYFKEWQNTYQTGRTGESVSAVLSELEISKL
jgi:hypothetical protein